MRRGHAETTARRNRPPDHLRVTWSGVPVRIALAGARLADFQGQIIGFDRSWVKVRFEGKKPRLREGTGVGLQFGTGREASPPLQGIVWTLDPDDVMTVLLSLSTREFESLRSLAGQVVEERKASVRPPSPPAWLDWRSSGRGARSPGARPAPPEAPVEGSSEAEGPSPSLVSDPPAAPVEATEPQTSVDQTPEPAEPPAEAQQPAPPPQAAPRVREGDYKGAAQFFFEGLRTQPIKLSLWCALGATLDQLGKKKAAADVLQHVVLHGRTDSREVHLARSWLERLGAAAEAEERRRPEPSAASHAGAQAESVEPPSEPQAPRAPAEPREPRPSEPPRARPPADPALQTETRPVEARRRPPARPPVVEDEFGSYEAPPAAPPQPRARRASPPEAPEVRVKPSPPAPAPQGGGRAVPARRRRGVGPSPAEQAALLAAQGNYAEAANLYAEAVRAKPEDPTLWYALGVTLRRLNRPQEAAEALQRVIRHGEPESLVRLARLWLERGGVGAEPADDAGGGSPRKGRPRRGGSDRD